MHLSRRLLCRKSAIVGSISSRALHQTWRPHLCSFTTRAPSLEAAHGVDRHKKGPVMPDHMTLTFLGTAAGKPSETRNVSSLALQVDGQIWVVDAGEGTQHQFSKSSLKMGKVSHVFVTHMHADHINGLPGLLSTISAGEGNVLPGKDDPRLDESQRLRPTEIYGPCGLREFLRVNFRLTHTVLTRPYIVHELLFEDEGVYEGQLHVSERQGQNIRQKEGVWRGFATINGVDVSAGPILHTVRCLGFVFQERPRPQPLDPALYVPHLKDPVNAASLRGQGIKNPMSVLSTLTRDRQSITLADGTMLKPPPLGGPGRKLVILGDTYDASPITELAQGADLLVHESTNAYLPELDDSQTPGKLRSDGTPVSRESVEALAKEHGHSTPEVAGRFARTIHSKRLLLNHLSVKYPDYSDEERDGEGETIKKARKSIQEIARLASEAWAGGRAVVARDFLTVEIPRVDKS